MNSTPNTLIDGRRLKAPPLRTFAATYFFAPNGGIAGQVRETFVQCRDARAAEYEIAKKVGPGFNGIIELEECAESRMDRAAVYLDEAGKRPRPSFWERWKFWKNWRKKA